MIARCIIISLLGLLPVFVFGQNTLALGDWAQFSSFRTSNYVTGGDGLVFFSNETGVVIVHEDNSIEYLTKVEGLSDVDISSIHYQEDSDLLIIGYENGNIDLYENREITNLNDIVLNLTIQQDRRIKNMFEAQNGFIYLATDFGIVVLDPQERSFPSTVFTPEPVNQVTVFQDEIYAALDNGLFKVSQSNNIVDFSNWSFLGIDYGLPAQYTSTVIGEFGGYLYTSANGDVYKLDGANQIADLIYTEPGFVPVYLYSGSQQVFVGLGKFGNNGTEERGKTLGIDKSDNIETSNFNCVARPAYIYEDDNGLLWFADRFDILSKSTSLSARCTSEDLNTPIFNVVQDVKVIDNTLYVSGGGVSDNFTYLGRQRGTMFRADGIWDAYSTFTIDELDNVRDHFQIEASMNEDKIFIATIYSGLIEFDPMAIEFTVHNELNSPLRSAFGDIPERVRVFGIDFDSQENLWMTNFNTSTPIKMMRPDGTWESFNPRNVDERLTFLVVDDNDNLWASVESDGGAVAVMNFGDPNTTSDDQIKIKSTSNSEIQNNRVRSLVVDLDGAVWVGTDQGIVIFNCSDPFDDECTGSRPLVLKDDFFDFLLSEEVINTIAVDPANRKWIGTNNGIFLQSEDGREELEHFTEQNSPLFTNRVVELEVDEENGLLYIGTERGLMAYRSDAIEGGTVHSSNVIAFPNPVRPDYDGPIAITGLAQNSNVKIANVNGQLVFETESLGGQAVWDGKDFSGRRVSSGVYYVFAATNSFFGSSDGAIAKILILH